MSWKSLTFVSKSPQELLGPEDTHVYLKRIPHETSDVRLKVSAEAPGEDSPPELLKFRCSGAPEEKKFLRSSGSETAEEKESSSGAPQENSLQEFCLLRSS